MGEDRPQRWRPLQSIPVAAQDAVLSGFGFAIGLVSVLADGRLVSPGTPVVLGWVALVCLCVLVARRHPLAAALSAALIIGLGRLLHGAPALPASFDGLSIPLFVLAYSLGSRTSITRSLPAVVALAACSQFVEIELNPFIAIATAGPWAVGLIVRSRGQARAELEARSLELAHEQERYEAESVRYERARIARELHDIVAHCVTVMVVQATAGQYLAGRDPAAAGETLDAISESARQAQTEIGRLVALLEQPPQRVVSRIEDLVGRARATGLVISYQLVGDTDELPAETFDAAYRVVQEALTNALKHAPGAAVRIAVRCTEKEVHLQIGNGPAAAPRLELAGAGGGHGIEGMRERIAGCGGHLEVGPTADGGWLVQAQLPSVRLRG